MTEYFGGHIADQAARLRAAREKHGVNAATVARLLGWSRQRVNSLENGRVEARARDVALYSRITGADPVWLLLGEEREAIEVPDEPASYRRPNGMNTHRERREQRAAARETKTPSLSTLPPTTRVSDRPAWRPANIGRDVRPVVPS